MKIKNKKYIFFTIILLGIIFNINLDVKADDLSYTTLCTYRNKVSDTDNRLVEIRYYNNTGDFQVFARYDNDNPNSPYYKIKFYDEVGNKNLPTKKIFWNDTALDLSLRGNNCPKYAYVDNTGMSNELCFANDPADCIDKDPGGLGTKFKGESELIVQTVDKYLESLKNSATVINNYPCSAAIYDVDSFNKVYSKLWLDIRIGNSTTVPDLVLNSQEYKANSDSYKTNYQNKVDACYEENKKELDEQLANGTLSEREYNKKIAELDQKSQSIKKNISNVLDYQPPKNDNSNIIYFECGILPPKIVEKINWYLNLIKYGGVVLAIGLGMLDLAKSILSDEGDANKKAIQKMTKRLIAAAVIFIIPLIIQFVLTTIEIGGVDPKNPLCIKRTK